jgi:hypothetical protein
MNKYHAKKTVVSGITFDSKAEARRYGQLIMLERAGQVTGITRQVPFVLAPKVKLDGDKRIKPAMKYIADFVYSDLATGRIIVEDVKGVITQAFRIKQHLMATVHGIQVQIV